MNINAKQHVYHGPQIGTQKRVSGGVSAASTASLSSGSSGHSMGRAGMSAAMGGLGQNHGGFGTTALPSANTLTQRSVMDVVVRTVTDIRQIFVSTGQSTSGFGGSTNGQTFSLGYTPSSPAASPLAGDQSVIMTSQGGVAASAAPTVVSDTAVTTKVTAGPKQSTASAGKAKAVSLSDQNIMQRGEARTHGVTSRHGSHGVHQPIKAVNSAVQDLDQVLQLVSDTIKTADGASDQSRVEPKNS